MLEQKIPRRKSDMIFPFRYLTFWALSLHILYALRILPYNTFWLAVLVVFGSMYHNLFINKRYSFVYDFALHYLPVLVFLGVYVYRKQTPSFSNEEYLLPWIVLVIYIVMVGGPTKIRLYYSDHMYYFLHKT